MRKIKRLVKQIVAAHYIIGIAFSRILCQASTQSLLALQCMKGKQKFFTILILGLLSAIGPFSIDMYLPGFPGIAKDLQTTIPRVGLSLSSFFIGICFGQFLYGPLLDRFGRKPPLYAGMILYLIASIGCIFVKSIDALIIIRLFQGLGGCAGMVAARALVRDIFPVSEIAKIFSLLMLVIAVSPIIAPTTGGFMAAHFGWQYIFVLLGVVAFLILIAIHFVLPAGRQADTTLSLRPRSTINNFLMVAKLPQFMVYAFAGAIASAGLYAYIAGSPFVFMEIYKVSEQQYGLIFAIIAAGLIIASQVNSLMLRRYSSEQIIRIALLLQAITGITLCAGSIFNIWNVYEMVGLIFIFLSCQGFTFPNSSALSLAPFAKNAGTASALLGGIQMGIGTLSSAAVSLFNNKTPLSMTGVMALCACIAFSVLIIGRKYIQYNAGTGDVKEQTTEMITNV